MSNQSTSIDPVLIPQPGLAHARHAVQFYDDEDFLIDQVARYLAEGLAAGAPVIVIATETHRDQFARRLRLLGCDVATVIAGGKLVLRDAAETLATFMVGDLPDPRRFQQSIGDAVAALGGHPTYAFGEMVDLLWRDGNRRGALALERRWNELGARDPLQLLCAYRMGSFLDAGACHGFAEICGTHDDVRPTEALPALAPVASELEQRTRSLEAEIAHRKELEIALREALDGAEEARERAIWFNEVFAGMLGHELRNPLGAITVGARYVSRTGGGEKATRVAARILSSAERMARMIDQLLDFTRLRVGDGIEIARTRIDLGELCFQLRDELEAGNPDASVQLELVGDLAGLWDRERLREVLGNLAGNAIAHGQGKAIRIVVDGSATGAVTLDVHNRGPIDPEVLPVLFEPFRGNQRRTRTAGLGLGLYITRRIILAHGGSIQADSDEERGTCMRVGLPRGPIAL